MRAKQRKKEWKMSKWTRTRTHFCWAWKCLQKKKMQFNFLYVNGLIIHYSTLHIKKKKKKKNRKITNPTNYLNEINSLILK